MASSTTVQNPYYLGPLTTQAALPSCQSSFEDTYNYGIYWGTVHNVLIPSCYPTSYAIDGYYSPGICPSGWTKACLINKQYYPPNTSAFTLGPATTGIVCCPQSYGCYSGESPYAFCVSSTTFATNTVLDVGVTSQTVLDLRTLTAGLNYQIGGKPVLVAYQSTDAVAVDFFESTQSSTSQTSSTLSTSSMSLASSTTSAAPTPKSTSAETLNSLPLSTKIAIGVAVPIVVILAVLLAWLIFRYRRKRLAGRAVPMPTSEVANPASHTRHNTTDYPSKLTAPNEPWYYPQELPGHSTNTAVSPNSRSELGSSHDRSRRSQMYE